MARLFCFGLGYTALTLARRLSAAGWSVGGTCREPDRAAALRAEGIDAIVADRTHPPANPDSMIAGATHLLASIPPDAAGDPALALWGPAIARQAIARHRGLVWAGYLSTTGVYGDHDGGWVDETTPLNPTGERGQRRADAEAAWQALLPVGVPVHLFRLAGIYGPGRSALDTVRAGRAQRIVKPGQVFSRVHVDDIARVLAASIERPRPGAVYNVCDDNPAPPDEVVAYACELLGVASPPEIPFETASLSDMARSFYADNKRVSNRLIKEELGVELRYPDYRTGLQALLAQA
ncbi:NAD(P)-dependent oxidoreductase [Aliidongia dinghuensis]|uniref:NAD(P)-dependent oxidoreductase n=1 Tax=Aliidongia dinghuensis TaxID=1867774 RepID=A0A8J2YRE4_9PROT|nr:SDR family oxidoreductase [Aliidongia dinghuensis]GGF09114.1 NAD(P)-dependent oxidoreductase [Aliidongia dinghuensis]